MVPRAAHAGPDHKPVGERPVIMAAMRIDRENLRARTRQQHLFVAHMANKHVVLEVFRADALGEIGTCG
jgi:hypothetical protein